MEFPVGGGFATKYPNEHKKLIGLLFNSIADVIDLMDAEVGGF